MVALSKQKTGSLQAAGSQTVFSNLFKVAASDRPNHHWVVI